MGNKPAIASETKVVVVGEIAHGDRRRNNHIITSKYTIYGFLFQNLYEQFRRFANMYFLIVSLIAVFIDSPVSPITSIAPLIFVLAVTMIKQGYEDWLRHRADHLVNNEKVNIIRNSTLQPVKCQSLRPGEIIRISRDSDVPCDAVLLWTSDSRGKCFVTTANLDGETSLKPLKVPTPLMGTSIDAIKGEKIVLECLRPEPDIYTFYGKIKVGEGGMEHPLGIDNLLLRGSRVKNTEWAICCALYTGKDTKLSLNSRITRNKFTSSETYINKFLLFYLVVLIIEMVVSFFLKRHMETTFPNHEQYIGNYESYYTFKSIAQDIFSFMLLYFYEIPISLYVTIELHKFIGSLYFNWDTRLICPETKQPALANSSDLNEELGQVEIMFSDKTGTLTKNDMYFQMCSINGELYIERDNKLYEMNLSWNSGETVEAIEVLKPDIDFFFTILALCHAVQVEESGNFPEMNNNNFYSHKTPIPQYQSMSSDEIAFVRAAANRGIIYYGEESNKMIIKSKDGKMDVYEKLQVLEFTSARKRMSVIVRDTYGKIWLLCKGAESSIIPLCKDSDKIAEINTHVQFFAEKGLRTLAVAYKELSEEDYAMICQEIIRVNMDVNSHANDVGRWRSLEDGLTLLGATGVEDRLQDNVVDTLESLREAGIKIWVLTGDKIETAINVAQSCGHILPKAEKIFLTEITTSDNLEVQLSQCIKAAESEVETTLTLVLDGQTFALIIDSTFENSFVNMALKCEAVICCRLSPIQKSQIVRLVKKSENRPITAAIGDGANDISMIQEAHVGFGIYGREGRQAARCADFAFKNFMMLKIILLVHGHWYYQRLGTLVQYSFYKNFAFANLMLFFEINSIFSTQSVFDSMYLMLFNVVFASVPIFVSSLTEKCHLDEVLVSQPWLYKKQVDKKVLSWRNFFGWTLIGIYHSFIIYCFLYLLWYKGGVINVDGKPADLWSFGAALFMNVIVVINLKLWMCIRYSTYIFIASVVLSILAFILFANIYSVFYINYDGDVLWTFIRLEASLTFWLATILISVMCLLPDYLTLITKSMLHMKNNRTDVEAVAFDITKL